MPYDVALLTDDAGRTAKEIENLTNGLTAVASYWYVGNTDQAATYMSEKAEQPFVLDCRRSYSPNSDLAAQELWNTQGLAVIKWDEICFVRPADLTTVIDAFIAAREEGGLP